MFASVALIMALATSADPATKVVSVCQVRANPTQYANRWIRVRATALQTMHGIGLIDSHCPGMMIALGEETDKNPSGNSDFYAASIRSMLKGEPQVIVTIDGIYWYKAARYPGSRLDKYQVRRFTLGKARR